MRDHISCRRLGDRNESNKEGILPTCPAVASLQERIAMLVAGILVTNIPLTPSLQYSTKSPR